jgi:hypothetical protein
MAGTVRLAEYAVRLLVDRFQVGYEQRAAECSMRGVRCVAVWLLPSWLVCPVGRRVGGWCRQTELPGVLELGIAQRWLLLCLRCTGESARHWITSPGRH